MHKLNRLNLVYFVFSYKMFDWSSNGELGFVLLLLNKNYIPFTNLQIQIICHDIIMV